MREMKFRALFVSCGFFLASCTGQGPTQTPFPFMDQETQAQAVTESASKEFDDNTDNPDVQVEEIEFFSGPRRRGDVSTTITSIGSVEALRVVPSPLTAVRPRAGDVVRPGGRITFEWLSSDPGLTRIGVDLDCRFPSDTRVEAGGWGIDVWNLRSGTKGGSYTMDIPCTIASEMVCWVSYRDTVAFNNWGADTFSTRGPNFSLGLANRDTCRNPILWPDYGYIGKAARVGQTVTLHGYYMPANIMVTLAISVLKEGGGTGASRRIPLKSDANGQLHPSIVVDMPGYWTAWIEVPGGRTNSRSWDVRK